MSRLKELFTEKKEILNIYFTAGFPKLDDTVKIGLELAKNGVDIIEIGIPYSDPLADGRTIQESSKQALDNGMTLEILFEQVKQLRSGTNIPIVLMGYYNQLLQYGVDSFLEMSNSTGVDGLIIPDLPVDIYLKEHQKKAEETGIDFVFLVTPQTSTNRIRTIDAATSGFLYVVSSYSTTGGSEGFGVRETSYFNRLKNMNLRSPKLIGFGVRDRENYTVGCTYAEGVIIGSAFIRALMEDNDIEKSIKKFINTIR